MITRVDASVNPFSRCPRCDAEIIPGFGRYRVLDLDGELHDCPRLPETGGTIQECARCERVVWVEPDGSKSEYGLRPIVNDKGEIIKIEGLGQTRQPHRCIPGGRPQSPSLPTSPSEHKQQTTGSNPLSELEALIGKPTEAGEET